MEKNSKISVTETVKPCVEFRRNSTGRVTPRSFSASNEKVLPRYLRASTGSCHDFCKYGKSDVLSKRNHHIPLPSSSGGNSESSRKQSLDRNSAMKESRKMMTNFNLNKKKNSLLDKQTTQSSTRNTVEQKNSAFFIKTYTKKAILAPDKAIISSKAKVSPFGSKSLCKSPGVHGTRYNGKTSTLSRTKLEERKIVTPTILNCKKQGDIKDVFSHEIQEVGLLHYECDDSKTIVETADAGNLLPVLYLEDLRSCISDGKEVKFENNDFGVFSSLQSENGRMESVITTVTEEDRNIIKETIDINELQNEALLLRKTSSCTSDDDFSSALSKDKKIKEEIITGTGLLADALELEQLNLSSSDDQEPNYGSEQHSSEPSELEFEDGELESEMTVLEEEGKKEGEYSNAYKLTFRRGQVIELHAERNSPKRLKFRRSRSMRGQMNDDASDFVSSEAESVVLRRSEIEEKKDVQTLFNHVIEKTASKLVETRKSKVKALVGAFETVISLQ